MTGFGPVKLLPGIADDWTINSAVTLPIGVEAYAAFALSAWLTSAPVGTTTRAFARGSALAALGLGMFGQVAYHLLEVAHQAAITAGEVARTAEATAPWWITTLVSCLPVLVLGFGAALAHMLHRDRLTAESLTVERVDPVEPVEVTPDPGPGRGGRPVESVEVTPALTPAPAVNGRPVEVTPVEAGHDPDPDPAPVPAPRTDPLPVLTPVGLDGDPGRPVEPVEVTPAPAVNGRPVEVTPVEAGHDPDPDPAPIPDPAGLLTAQSRDSDKVRTAIAVLGLEATPGEVSEWLRDRGHVVKTEAIRSALRRERAKRTPVPAAGPVASVTSITRRGHE